jgi:UDP-glucose 4-epimerase
MTGSDSEIVHVPYREAFGSGFEDMERRVPDLSKIHQAIGYRPQHSLAETLRDVIDFERSAAAGGD